MSKEQQMNNVLNHLNEINKIVSNGLLYQQLKGEKLDENMLELRETTFEAQVLLTEYKTLIEQGVV